MRILVCCALFFVLSGANEKLYNELFMYYGAKYHIPPVLLWAIAKTESNFNHRAKNINKNGSVDIGLMQINSIHENTLKRKNLSLNDLYTPSVNVEMGAFVLSKCIAKHGISNKGLNCYNGNTQNNTYSYKVIKHLQTKRKEIIK